MQNKKVRPKKERTEKVFSFIVATQAYSNQEIRKRENTFYHSVFPIGKNIDLCSMYIIAQFLTDVKSFLIFYLGTVATYRPTHQHSQSKNPPLQKFLK